MARRYVGELVLVLSRTGSLTSALAHGPTWMARGQTSMAQDSGGDRLRRPSSAGRRRPTLRLQSTPSDQHEPIRQFAVASLFDMHKEESGVQHATEHLGERQVTKTDETGGASRHGARTTSAPPRLPIARMNNATLRPANFAAHPSPCKGSAPIPQPASPHRLFAPPRPACLPPLPTAVCTPCHTRCGTLGNLLHGRPLKAG